MRLRISHLFIGLVLVASFYLARNSANLSSPDTDKVQKSKPLVPRPPRKVVTVKEVLHRKEESPVAKKSYERKPLPEACDKIYDAIFTDDNEAFKFGETFTSEKEVEGCIASQEGVLAVDEAQFKKCLLKKPANEVAEKECWTLFALIKVNALNYQTENVANLQDLSEKELMARILGVFFGGVEKADFKKNIEAVDELIVREPDLYDAHKARVLFAMMPMVMENHPDKEFAERNFDRYYSSATDFATNDSQLYEFGMVRSKIFDKVGDDLLWHVESGEKEKPDLAITHYLRAAYEWREKKDRNAALAALQRAKIIDPQDKRFDEAISDIKSKKLGEKISFSINGSVKFDL